MKSIRHILSAILCAVVLLGAPGCTSTPERTREARIFDTCKSTYHGAREAYKAVVKLHLTGQLTDEQRAQADYGWVQFQNSFAITFESLNLNWSTATPEALQRLTADFLNLLRTL